MQQPDYRDQSELEVKGQTEENSQSDINATQKQENSQLEQGEKEADDALVSRSKSQAQTYTLENYRGLKFQPSAFSALTANTLFQ